MRNAFADEVLHIAERDKRIVLLSGDIGNRLFDPFKATFGDRFYNCGVAEANMIGVAAGLAQTGFRPIAYTIAPFLTYRAIEQIRVDLGYHHLPVTLVGTGAGLSYASLGATHHSCEDIGMLRTIPGMNVLAPCDALELRALLNCAVEQNNPTYIRIGKKGEPLVYDSQPDVSIGKASIVHQGNDVSLLVAGNMMPVALEAVKALESQTNLFFEVISMHSVKPLDTDLLSSLLRDRRGIVTLEEHSIIGGLGSAVAEYLVDHRSVLPCLRLACKDAFIHETTEQASARVLNHIDRESIVSRVSQFLKTLD